MRHAILEDLLSFRTTVAALLATYGAAVLTQRRGSVRFEIASQRPPPVEDRMDTAPISIAHTSAP